MKLSKEQIELAVLRHKAFHHKNFSEGDRLSKLLEETGINLAALDRQTKGPIRLPRQRKQPKNWTDTT